MTGCEALAGLALFTCVARDPACLPDQHKDLLPFIASTVQQESRFNPYAVRNEAEGRGYYFRTKAEAIEYAVAQDAQGVTLGLGWGQITHRYNWRLHTGTEGRAAITLLLSPCRNMLATANHYVAALGASIAFNAGPGRIGSPPAQSVAYAKRVIAGAAEMRQALSGAPAPTNPIEARPVVPHLRQPFDLFERAAQRRQHAPQPTAEGTEAAPAESNIIASLENSSSIPTTKHGE